jgi:hypothetical protein
MIHRAAMYIFILWLCKGTLMPGQSYLFEIAEEWSFLRKFVLYMQLSLVAEHGILYISWPPGLTLLPACTQLSI